jgi:hypothetical protein
VQIILLTYINRSGSTYLANILSSAENICVCPEVDAPVRLFLEDPGRKFKMNDRSLERIHSVFEDDRKMRTWDFQVTIDTFPSEVSTHYQAFITLLKAYARMQKPLANMVVFKAERIAALVPKIKEALTLTEKEALKIISLVRDPRAVIASQLRTPDPGSSLPMTRNPVRKAMQWNRYIQTIRENGEGTPPRLVLRFEDIIGNLDRSIDEISGFLGLEPGFIDPHKGELFSKLGEADRSIHSLVGQPPRKERITGWKSELDEDLVYQIERICGPYFTAFGYTRETEGSRPILDLVRYMQLAVALASKAFVKLIYYLGKRKSIH